MREELSCGTVEEACWGDDLVLFKDGWDAPLGGFVRRGSSSEELSSDAPSMNLRRSLASGPELSIGAIALERFWVVCGSDGFSEFTSEEACGGSEATVLTWRPADSSPPGGLLSSLCAEAAAADDGECWTPSSLPVEGPRSDGESSPFTGIAVVLLLILHSSNNIHRINPETANRSIHRHPRPETATRTRRTLKWIQERTATKTKDEKKQ